MGPQYFHWLSFDKLSSVQIQYAKKVPQNGFGIGGGGMAKYDLTVENTSSPVKNIDTWTVVAAVLTLERFTALYRLYSV